mmetsp:Transcript_93370/g.114369  ORF Transcript_93370/g.114369 Transcript_93370/m.114369 type:complete len:187 (+) Transcript_93370:86-646(+)
MDAKTQTNSKITHNEYETKFENSEKIKKDLLRQNTLLKENLNNINADNIKYAKNMNKYKLIIKDKDKIINELRTKLRKENNSKRKIKKFHNELKQKFDDISSIYTQFDISPLMNSNEIQNNNNKKKRKSIETNINTPKAKKQKISHPSFSGSLLSASKSILSYFRSPGIITNNDSDMDNDSEDIDL